MSVTPAGRDFGGKGFERDIAQHRAGWQGLVQHEGAHHAEQQGAVKRSAAGETHDGTVADELDRGGA